MSNFKELRLSRQTLILFAPISVAAVPLAFAERMTREIFIDSLFIGLISTSLTILFGLGLDRIAEKNLFGSRGNRRPVNLFLILILLGVFRGVAIYLGTNIFDLQQSVNLFSKILASVSSTLFWIYLLASFENALTDFRETIKDIWRRTIFLASLEKHGNQSVYVSEEVLAEYNTLVNSLQGIISVKEDQVQDKSYFLSLSSQLREVIEESVRPLSHRIWLKNNTLIPRLNVVRYIVFTTNNLAKTLLSSGIALALISSFNLNTQFGITRSFSSVAIVLGVFFTLHFAGQKFLGQFFTTILGKDFHSFCSRRAHFTLLYGVNRFIFADDLGAWNAFYLLLTPFIQVMVGSAISVRADLVSLERELNSKLEKVVLREGSRSGLLDGEFASYLHNSVQSELMALSYQLERDEPDEKLEEKKEALARLHSRLKKGVEDDFNDFFESAVDRVSRLESAWRGIAKVEISIPAEILQRESVGFLVVQVIEESILNAVRFCKARKVSAYVEDLQASSFTLVVTNDGTPPSETGNGLGTKWLDAQFPEKWHREDSADGSSLIIRF
jgi:signal transduction histidine kinase